MSPPDPKAPGDEEEAPKATALAELARKARERLGPEPDIVTPAAARTLATILRDLKGMPELMVTREHKFRLRLGRKGKVGSIALEYHPNIRALELGYINMPGSDPTTVKMHRYTYHPERDAERGEWNRLDEGGEFIADVQAALQRFYPELGND